MNQIRCQLRPVALAALMQCCWSSPLMADAETGEYIFKLAGCLACHTEPVEGAKPLAGGHGLETPFGKFFAPNITPHPEQGIGRWTVDDFRAALRDGVAPDGGDYYPVFPYTSYTQMSDSDIAALFTYLRTVKPDARANQDHDIPWYMRWRFTNWMWKLLFFSSGPYEADAQQSASWNRGAYISRALAHCSECHSPRGWSGAIDTSLYLAGTLDGPGGTTVPNITSDKQSGIGEWAKVDLSAYLEYGEMPDGDYAGGLMAEVIDNGLSMMTAADRSALVEYLMSLPAIHRPELTNPE
jgi:mono/diheme cytochrome c family protein